MKFHKISAALGLGLLGLFVLSACTPKIPDGATAVTGFSSEKYLGKWYEIARFDYRFERNLKNVTAEYALNENGTIKVLNKGYNTEKNKWAEAEGEARFVQDKTVARLKVSFFKPFWAGYNVIDLEDYRYALVAGDDLDYLWILSREKTIPENIKQRFLKKAKAIGYKTENLIWVEQD
ncbi:lipocalin family protein [Chryseobacterium sp.]|uniref:lipocalin family protein n=1 Tax=Chryseobacterium sp. TaxID=1871047 RepID=UPI0011C8FF9B|nr:lipocalin family protein [Chryseobacterium sp.]TXF79450.1 lipocalin [Chryseobacterium sp.]